MYILWISERREAGELERNIHNEMEGLLLHEFYAIRPLVEK